MRPLTALPSVGCAIAALDRLTAAMRRGAPPAEIARLREAYEVTEKRALRQIEAFENMMTKTFGLETTQ